MTARKRKPVALVQFGQTVRRLREEGGWSQEELGDRAGLHRTYIGGIERGERNVSLLNIVALARAFGVESPRLLADL
jgi:transcriptional regulator with XRE-family HTH domain